MFTPARIVAALDAALKGAAISMVAARAFDDEPVTVGERTLAVTPRAVPPARCRCINGCHR